MWLKYPIISALFILIFAAQFGFAPVFSVIKIAPNLIFALFFILLFSEIKNSRETGLFLPALAGILSDIFLFPYFGPSIISFVLVAMATRTAFDFIKEPSENKTFVYFLIFCVISFILHIAILSGIAAVFNFPFNFSVKLLLFDSLLTALLALIVFYGYEKIIYKLQAKKQLKLL